MGPSVRKPRRAVTSNVKDYVSDKSGRLSPHGYRLPRGRPPRTLFMDGGNEDDGIRPGVHAPPGDGRPSG